MEFVKYPFFSNTQLILDWFYGWLDSMTSSAAAAAANTVAEPDSEPAAVELVATENACCC